MVPELKVKEHEAFKGYYCGLCKAIKENYTHAARFMLNYDCAVLSLMLSSMSDKQPTAKRERCIASPLKKKTIIHSDEASYAAAVNVMLGYGKVRDTAMDDNKLYAKLLGLLYRRVNQKASHRYDALADEFALRMKHLHRLEEERCGNVDEVAAEFAHLLGAVFALAPYDFIDDTTRKVLRHFGYNLGRWLYLADALDDIEKDAASGSYNVFLQRGVTDVKELKKEIREEAQFSLHYSLSEASKAYELLDIRRDKALIDNIIYLGLAKTTEDILTGHKCDRSKGEHHGSV